MLSDSQIKSLKIEDGKRHAEIQGHHEVAHRLHDRLEVIFEFAVGASLTENYPFIGLKKALAPKPRVTNQPA